MREGKTPLEASIVGARELVGPIIAMTITLAAVYAPIGFQGGLTGALFREFAFTLAGAVFISGVVALTLSPMMSSRLLSRSNTARMVSARRSIACSTASRRATTRMLAAHARHATGGLHRLDRPLAAGRADVHVLAEGARAQRGPGRGVRRDRRARQRDARAAHAVHRARSSASSNRARVRPQLPDHVPERRLRRHAREAVGGAQAQHLPDPAGAVRQAHGASRESARRCSCRRRCRARASSRSSSSSRRRRATKSCCATRSRSRQEAMKSGQFAFPPITDVQIDQAKTEIVLDRDKIGVDGPQHAAGRRRSLVDARRQLRQPLQHRRAQLQGHRAGRARGDRLTPDQLEDIHVTGPSGSSCRSARSRRSADGVEPRTLEPLPAAQRDQDLRRRAARRRRRAERAGRRGGAGSCRRATASTTRASRGSSVRRAGKFLPAMGLAIVLIFLVLAAQFNSFRDPFVILAGLGAARDVRRDDLHLPEVRRPARNALQADRRLDDDAQHLLAGRSGHARRSRLQERDLDRRVRERPASARHVARSPPSAKPRAPACAPS